MARKFLDTAAVFKLYRAEPNSAAVWAEISEEDTLLIAQITPLEFQSAFYGLVRQKSISLADAQDYIQSFRTDMSGYEIVSVDDAVISRAGQLLDMHSAKISLRPMDAMQLAVALEEHAREPLDAFITTDVALATVAAASGLIVLP